MNYQSGFETHGLRQFAGMIDKYLSEHDQSDLSEQNVQQFIKWASKKETYKFYLDALLGAGILNVAERIKQDNEKNNNVAQ